MSTSYESIRIDRDGAIAEIVLDNADRLNAMSPQFFQEIKLACEELDADDDINAIIIWAEGRLFTAGLDLSVAAGTFSGSGSDAAKNKALY